MEQFLHDVVTFSTNIVEHVSHGTGSRVACRKHSLMTEDTVCLLGFRKGNI